MRSPEEAGWEHRHDRAYDECAPSTVLVPRPDGRVTLLCSFDRAFLAAATREVLARGR